MTACWRSRPVTRAATSHLAMPLDDRLAQVAALPQTQPDAKEIQVDRVKFLRYGQTRGDYDQVVQMLSAADPHGK